MSATALAEAAHDEPYCLAATLPATDGVLASTLSLRHAGLQRVNLRWRLAGAEGTPVHAVLGGISATRHVAAVRHDEPEGWWQVQVGPGRTFDLSRCRVLSFDWVGRDGTLDAPISSADQADALAVLLDHLGIARLASIVGSSYGAMVGLAFAERYPALVERLVVISGADRADPYAAAWRALQRRVLELGRDGLANLIERCCDHALAIHDGIVALDGATSIARPVMNQGMIRFHNAAGTNISDAVIAAINASGEAFFSGTLWHGERTMRISVLPGPTSK